MNELASTALKELYNYPDKSFKSRLKNGLKKILRRGGKPKDPINWPNSLLALGLLDYAQTLEGNNDDRKKVIDEVERYYNIWINKGSAIRSIEDGIAGEVLYKLYKLTGNNKYKDSAKKLYSYVLSAPKDEVGNIIYNPRNGNKYIFADMIGMACPLISAENIGESRRQIENFIQFGVNTFGKIPFHAYKYDTREKYGMAGWGRSYGWIIRGLGYSIRYSLDNYDTNSEIGNDTVALIDLLFELIDSVFLNIRKDGLFSWQIPCPEGHVDTSASALIFDGLYEGVIGIMNSNESLNNAYKDSLNRNYERLLAASDSLKMKIHNGRVTDAEAECIDFGVYPQTYGSYPWADGPALSFLSKMKSI